MNNTTIETAASFVANKTAPILVQQVQQGASWWVLFLAAVGAVALISGALKYGQQILTYFVIGPLALLYLGYKIYKNKKMHNKPYQNEVQK